MLEPLSPRLTQLLLSRGLCRPRDLRRSRRIVRRLTRDLPAFDSVWIDALVRDHVLTPFQAGLLESDRPEEIAVGDYLLIERLGGTARSATYLARKGRSRRRVAIKRMHLREEQREEARERLSRLCRQGAASRRASPLLPVELFVDERYVSVVSPYCPGFNLRELMIRRGRFPSRVVRAIARQALDGLARLAELKLVHGDVRLENIKLGPDGRAVLIETGIRAAVMPQLTFVAELTSESCDAVAPELIATGRVADDRSDLYSLGCVLWNLLTGRPPIKEADPLEKLAAHQRRGIGDVREWAPDVPADLAEAVFRLTRRDPEERPRDARAALELFGRPGWSDRRTVKEFQSYFLSQAPAWTIRERRPGRFPWGAATALLLLLSGLSVLLLHEGAKAEFLAFIERVSGDAELANDEDNVAVKPASAETRLALPAPDAHGVIVLDREGPYRSGELSAVGPLALRAAEGVAPLVECDTPLKISCEALTLDGIAFRAPKIDATTTLVLVRSHDLTIRNCRFDLFAEDESASRQGIAVAWKSVDPRDRSGGRVRMQNVVCRGGDSQFYFAAAPARWDVDNLLSLQANAFCRLKHWPSSSRPLEIEFARVTLRRVGACLKFDPPASPDEVAGQIFLDARQSVFDLRETASALFAFEQEQVSVNLLSHLTLVGDDTLISDSAVIAGRLSATAPGQPARIVPLPSDTIAIEGVMAAPYAFAEGPSPRADDSAVVDVSGPRLSPELPGIRAADLPTIQP